MRTNIVTKATAGLLFLCLLIAPVVRGEVGESRDSFAKIDEAYLSGALDRSEMLVNQMKAFFAPEDLPVQFKSSVEPALKSGTGLIMEVMEHWDDFAPDDQALLSAYMARPTMQCAYDSPLGLFKIHYDTTLPEMVPPEDGNGNSIPDYVERIGLYMDSSYVTYVTHLGYLPAPSDHGTGGDDKYDVYLLSIGGYGATTPDAPGDSAWSDYASYISIHYSFAGFPPNDDPEGDVIGAQKVTCAHEYYHAVQLAYKFDFNGLLWLMESGSTWMEEYVYPVVNDNYYYLPYFFSVPEVNLAEFYGTHKYGAFVWTAFLHQRFDISVLRAMWEAIRYNGAFDAIDSALAPFGTNVAGAFTEFAIWNYHTGTRAVPGRYYADATDYPEITVDIIEPTLIHDSIGPINPPEAMACNYIELEVDTSVHGNFEITLDGDDLVKWSLATVMQGFADTSLMAVGFATYPVVLTLPYIEDYERVVAIPSVVSHYVDGSDYNVSTRLLPYGDANYDAVTNVGDITYVVNYVFKQGLAPKPFWQSGDANCDGKVDVGDAVRLINYVFKGGEVPCASR